MLTSSKATTQPTLSKAFQARLVGLHVSRCQVLFCACLNRQRVYLSNARIFSLLLPSVFLSTPPAFGSETIFPSACRLPSLVVVL